MEKITKVLLIILFLIFSIIVNRSASPQEIHSTRITKEVPNITKKMYLKDGRMIECDIAWEGMASEIYCMKSGTAVGMVVYHKISDEAFIIAYSAGDVDLIRTFGESTATEIAKRYQKRVKYRELMSRPMIVTPEQEKRIKKQTLERERKRATELKDAGITEETIRVEKRRLEERGEWGKIRELERDPALYFSKQRLQQKATCYTECREEGYNSPDCAKRCGGGKAAACYDECRGKGYTASGCKEWCYWLR